MARKHLKTPASEAHKPDIQFENHGSIILIRPITPAGEQWTDEHLPDDAQTFGGAVACEPRYAQPIADGAMADGLLVAFG